uniref:Syntaxin 6 putative n=1 Tax=Albugo laibachii Nc14 TaxID=890382 RepID=F0W4W1_9STRA|nr:syntaxin 6 putative [Albugo laibachii Nc14]|eukprot:CCA16150.1 syntaxin 6 putative [Albugo laibachii Nc14]
MSYDASDANLWAENASETIEMSSNVEASSDPYYVFKDELESTIAAVNVKYTHWKLIMELEDSPMSKEIPELIAEIEKKIAAAEHSLQFLDQTIVIVEANRKKFEHIAQSEIAKRREFVASKKMELVNISKELSTIEVRRRIEKEEKKQLMPHHYPMHESTEDSVLATHDRVQQQLMEEQDESLNGLSKSVSHLNTVAVEINNEISTQNKMLDELGHDVDEAHDRMSYVVDRISRLLKTKDRCQLGLIFFLVIVLIVMTFLVIYT